VPEAAVNNPGSQDAQDLRSLIQTAAQPDHTQAPEAVGGGGGDAAELANSLVQLMQADPGLASKIADVIEQHFSGGGSMSEPLGNMPVAPEPQSSLAPPGPPAPGAAAASQVPPDLLQRLAALEQAVNHMQRPLADYQLDRELAQLRQRYEQLRQHYGDVLPDKFDALERPVLEKYQAILQGQIPPHELAFLAALSETLHSGDTPLKDRILAAVAKQAPQAPRVEGPGGMAAANEEKPPVARTTAERMERLKELWRTIMSQNPGE